MTPRAPLRAAGLLSAVVAVAVLGTGSASAAPVYVQDATWVQLDAGLRLRVEPTDFGSAHAEDAPRIAWDQAVDRAGRRPLPASTYDGLYDQFRCHAVQAQTKATWNLEAWRPNVTYQETLAAFCNPTRG